MSYRNETVEILKRRTDNVNAVKVSLKFDYVRGKHIVPPGKR